MVEPPIPAPIALKEKDEVPGAMPPVTVMPPRVPANAPVPALPGVTPDRSRKVSARPVLPPSKLMSSAQDAMMRVTMGAPRSLEGAIKSAESIRDPLLSARLPGSTCRMGNRSIIRCH